MPTPRRKTTGALSRASKQQIASPDQAKITRKPDVPDSTPALELRTDTPLPDICGQRDACSILSMSASTLSYRRRALEVAVAYTDGAFGPVPIPVFDDPAKAEAWRAAAHLYVPEWGAEKRPHGTWEYSRSACQKHRDLGARWSVEARATFFATLRGRGTSSGDLENRSDAAVPSSEE